MADDWTQDQKVRWIRGASAREGHGAFRCVTSGNQELQVDRRVGISLGRRGIGRGLAAEQGVSPSAAGGTDGSRRVRPLADYVRGTHANRSIRWANTLRIISDREVFKDENGAAQPAMRWLLDVITNSEAAEKHRVFRIQSLEVLDTLGLERRQGFRYAIEEFAAPSWTCLANRWRQARMTDPARRGLYEKKILELEERLSHYIVLASPSSHRPCVLKACVKIWRKRLIGASRTATTRCRWPCHPRTLTVPGNPTRTHSSMPGPKAWRRTKVYRWINRIWRRLPWRGSSMPMAISQATRPRSIAAYKPIGGCCGSIHHNNGTPRKLTLRRISTTSRRSTTR